MRRKTYLIQNLAYDSLYEKWKQPLAILGDTCAFCNYANKGRTRCVIPKILCRACKKGNRKSLFSVLTERTKSTNTDIYGIKIITVGNAEGLPELNLMRHAMYELSSDGKLSKITKQKIKRAIDNE